MTSTTKTTMTTMTSTTAHHNNIAFIGGGNMASAIVGGLLKSGSAPGQIQIVEPFAAQRAKLLQQFGIHALQAPGPELAHAAMVVWAVKPQMFKDAAVQIRIHTKDALHLSVAAGIRSGSIADWLVTQRVVRCMPNTPALVGKGITALFARSAVTADDRAVIERVIHTTGEYFWLSDETQLDAVTALSGSGPAYVFYFMEAMIEAGTAMGLTREQGHQLAVSTFAGAADLAKASSESPEVLRAQVTSRGGTTYAALTNMEQNDIKNLFMQAMHAARQRAHELGDEFGAA